MQRVRSPGAKAMKSSAMHYRLMNEYSVAWPFWGDDGLAADGTPSLPPRIEAAVRDWAAGFNGSYSWEHGWPNATAAREHAEQSRRLHAIIEKLLSPDDTVTLDLWETTHSGGPKGHGRSA
ncbi:hypothetical protein ITJ42_00035 [Clavibacter michiganensis subsp. phaseoli]|uniref:Uncharacterized protein n=1 Tax=Clavibacter phaseoli TaxID=1734031 RepID=A0A8I0S621_9MICO|nr:hypothetical protein [Clavibacter phaseoli]MBF4629601.1 hypothetical protein [Clavibacter phaseoli]